MDMSVAVTKVAASALMNEKELSAQNTLLAGFVACVKATRASPLPALGPYRVVSEQLVAAVQASAQLLASPFENKGAVVPVPWPCTTNEIDEVLARHTG